MPRIFEFSTAIEKHYDTTLTQWVARSFNTNDYDFNSFGNLQSIPQIINFAIHKDLFDVKPSTNQSAYVGRYLNQEWAVLAVASYIPEIDRNSTPSDIWQQYQNGTLRMAPVYRYFCCQNDSQSYDSNLMASLLYWYMKQNYPPFDPSNRQPICDQIPISSISNSTKNVLTIINNFNQEKTLKGNIKEDELLSVISNLPQSERIGFSFAFNVSNGASLAKTGKFRLIQDNQNNQIFLLPNKALTQNLNVINNSSNAKDLLLKLCNSKVSNQTILTYLANLLNLNLEQDSWLNVFKDELHIDEYINRETKTPPDKYIRLLLIQAILVPSSIPKMLSFKKRANQKQLTLIKEFEKQFLDIMINVNYSNYLKFYQTTYGQYPKGEKPIYYYQNKEDNLAVNKTIQNLSNKISEAIWLWIIKTLEDKLKPESSLQQKKPKSQKEKRQENSVNLLSKIQQIFNKTYPSQSQSKANTLNDLTQEDTIWNFILRSSITIDFYNYFEGNVEFLSENFKEFIKLCYENNKAPSNQKLALAFTALQETWQDIDLVITAFFHYNIISNINSISINNIPVKLKTEIEESEILKLYLNPQKLRLKA